jgi:hypothetical protein
LLAGFKKKWLRSSEPDAASVLMTVRRLVSVTDLVSFDILTSPTPLWVVQS